MSQYPHTRHHITCEMDGETYRGNYWVAGKILTVSTSKGGKSRQVGAMTPEARALQLLGELVKEGKATPERALT